MEALPVDAPQSILFVGNSFTFYNNSIYSHLRKLLLAEDPALSPAFQPAVYEFSEKIRSKGAEPVLFMTWAYADRPEMANMLVEAYTSLGKTAGIRVIPVGLAFARARERVDGVRLHDADDVHPSLEGTYLAAAVFYSALYGKSSVRLGYTADLDETLARQLRTVAWETVKEYKEKTD